MKCTWLGQAGFYLVSDGGLSIMIDPYLSHNLEKTHGPDFHREVEIREEYFTCPLDVLVLTHLHDDHTDFDTLDRLLDRPEPVTILANLDTYWALRKRYPAHHLYNMFERGIEITLGDVLFRAVLAVHSDERAFGVVLESGGRKLWHTGDTMYHRDLAAWAGEGVDWMFFPINGWGNNMNAADACRLVNAVQPRVAVPIHWDMFAAYGYDPERFRKQFAELCPGREMRLLREYEEIEF